MLKIFHPQNAQMMISLSSIWEDFQIFAPQTVKRQLIRQDTFYFVVFFDVLKAVLLQGDLHITNIIESVHMSLRKISKNQGSFPSDEASLKLFYLELQSISQKWTMPIQNWKAARNRFTIQFDARMPEQYKIIRFHKIQDISVEAEERYYQEIAMKSSDTILLWPNSLHKTRGGSIGATACLTT